MEHDLLEGFSQALGVPADGALARYVREGKGGPSGRARLLAWDANSIHAFVFDTTNATGIRGASQVLRDIDEALRGGEELGLTKGQVLFSGGGSGLAVVAEDQVERVRERLHEVFALRSQIATCTVADVELRKGAEGFNQRVLAVGAALDRERVRCGPDAEPAVPFFALRCQVCGRRAAAVVTPRMGAPEEGRPECQPCHDRIEGGKRILSSHDEASDFSRIADGAREGEGFYAVVYLDGNGIGRTITSLASPLEYASFSEVLRKLLWDTFHAIADRYGLENERRGASRGVYQLPICGGDDVIAILPGEVAVPFARDFIAALETGADQQPALKGKPIGASAGVAIGQAGFPVRHLLAEAEGLLKTAKRRVYEAVMPRVRSALSFSVVTDGSPRSESIDPERWARGRDDLLLSGRPFSLEEIATFSRRFRIIREAEKKKVGRTQLYSLQSHALRGPRQFRNHVLYQIGRRVEWGELTVKLSGKNEAILREPETCEAQFAPIYAGRKVFDVADMIELLGHWREPKEEKEPS